VSRRPACLLALAALALAAAAAAAAERVRLYTGPEEGVQPQLGRELARWVAPAAGLLLEVIATPGPVDSLVRLREETTPRLALLPEDALHAYRSAAAGGQLEALRLLAPVRLVVPLHQEALYFIARRDASFDTIQDIREARINVGPLRGSTALAATSLYPALFEAPLPEARTSYFSHEDALARLLTDQSIDVVMVQAAQPAKLLAHMKPEAGRYIKLLRFAPATPDAAVLRVFSTAMLRAADYPNLLAEDLPALASRIHLVAYGHRRGEAGALLGRLAQAWCRQLPRLQAEGHPLWQEVALRLPDPALGRSTALPAARELASCLGETPPAPACTAADRILALCD
jgi:hypothetical protein